MAPRTLPGLGLSGFWALGEDGWNGGADENWRKISALVQLSVLSVVSTLPVSPANGDMHIVTSGANANSVAVRDNGAWVYYAPIEGWKAWDSSGNVEYLFDGSAWVARSRTISIGLFAAGVMTNSEKLMVYLVTEAISIPAGATGSFARADVAAAAAVTITLTKIASGGASSSVGTINFATGTTVATFTVASPVTLAAGDRIVFSGPATADAALADVSISLKGVLS